MAHTEEYDAQMKDSLPDVLESISKKVNEQVNELKTYVKRIFDSLQKDSDTLQIQLEDQKSSALTYATDIKKIKYIL